MILRWLRNPEAYPRHQNAGYTVMWKGYEDALCMYYNACCEEWARRGGRNVICQPEAISSCGGGASASARLPPWLGDEAFHRTHRSALLHKLPDHYGKFGWGVEIPVPGVNYLWPRPPSGEGGRTGNSVVAMFDATKLGPSLRVGFGTPEGTTAVERSTSQERS